MEKRSRQIGGREIARMALRLTEEGFLDVPPVNLEPSRLADLHVLLNAARNRVSQDTHGGHKRRAHRRLVRKSDGTLHLPAHGSYSQYGKNVRQFRKIDNKVVFSSAVQYLIETVEGIACAASSSLKAAKEREIGLHLIDYAPQGDEVAVSLPVGYHRDSEQYVAVVFLESTPNLGGGENGLAANPTLTVDRIVRLRQQLQMLVLTRKVMHCVYPMHSLDGQQAHRRVLLITVDEIKTAA